jgi:hypothetical protein
MSDLRIYQTAAGPMCGSCVEEKYGTEAVHDHPALWPYEANVWPGGYCCECNLTMPADGHPCGRSVPYANQAVSLGEYLRRVEAADKEAP